jgi:tripartite-type tricarboxylate transporter receptor subunit TctC
MKRLGAALAIVGTLLMPVRASADEWPSRPVRIICTFSAGGAADILARIVAEHMSTVFKQQFYVENRTGAAGMIGVQAAMNTPPDGYNLVITNVSLLVLNPVINPHSGFDPLRDLTNIAYLAGSPVVISVNPKSGIKTLKDFVARGKASDKPLTFSSSGVGSMGHLVGEMFAQEAGIKVEHVPYKGAAQGLTDLVGGHIVFSSQTVSSTSSMLQGGSLHGVAVASTERLTDYPDLPTFQQEGYPNVVSTIWFSLSGPAGLPADIAAKVNREANNALKTPEAVKRLQNEGSFAQAMTADEFRTFVTGEIKRWSPVVERAGLVNK